MSGFSYTLELIGLTICLNHFLWVSLFLCYAGNRDHGWSDNNETKWWMLDVPCLKCQKHVTFRSGITCANIGKIRGRFPACKGAWCADCFTAHYLDTFETAIPRDFNGANLAEVEDEIRFQKARAGDHLCTAFQCPNCQSQNIRGKSLEPGDAQDDAFECCATRVQLDAFWSHSSRTVAAHVREVNFSIKYAQRLGITNPFPRLGPFPLGDDMGMLQAIMVIMRSMEPGTGRGGRIKWNTARKNRSTGTVLWNVSPDSGSDIVLSSSSRRGRYVATSNPSEGAFYQMFALGCCARSGDIVNQDRAYTIELLQKLLTMYESEYNELGETMPLNAVCSCMFLLVTCLGGMRGFEAVWTDLATLRYDLTYCESLEDYSAVAWPIVGRFKAHNGIAGCYMIPIAGTTDSGIPFFEWAQRFTNIVSKGGRIDGWAFQREDGSRAKASDYRRNIFSKLEEIQATTNLIDQQVDIWEEFGIQRSGRRFFTTHTLKMGVDPILIELQARWSTDRANGERSVQRTMIHNYAEVRNMKDTLKKPSQAC